MIRETTTNPGIISGTCPGCGQALAVPISMCNRRLMCQACGTEVFIRVEDGQTPTTGLEGMLRAERQRLMDAGRWNLMCAIPAFVLGVLMVGLAMYQELHLRADPNMRLIIGALISLSLGCYWGVIAIRQVCRAWRIPKNA